MELAIQKLTALLYLITGLSHLIQPKVWIRLFIALRQQQEVGAFLNAYMHLPLGALIVTFHDVWSGPALLVTLIGWALTLKGTLYFLAPQIAIRSMARVSLDRTWEFRAAGIVGIGLAAAVAWIAYSST